MYPELLVAELQKWDWPNSDVRVLQLAFLQQAAIPDQGREAPAECKQQGSKTHTHPHPKQGKSVKLYLGLIMFGANIKSVLIWQPFLVPSHRGKFIDAKPLATKLYQANERKTCRSKTGACYRRAAVMCSALRSCKYLHVKPWSS